VPIVQKFYPQRFLLTNRDDVEKRRHNVKIVRDKLKLLNDNLQMYKNESLDIVKVLTQANQFISNQNFNHPTFQDLSQNNLGVQLKNPYSIIP
jgi:hypothetical protein